MSKVWFGALAGVLFLVACVAAPVQEMSDARQAIEAAQAAGAMQFAGGAMNEAQQLLDEARQALDNGMFDLARVRALEAKQVAIAARELAQGPDEN